MECVLGVSMTPIGIRMVLVEGAGADGLTVDHNVVDLISGDAGVGKLVDQLMAAIVGTREAAISGGHHLIATGVAWTDRTTGAQLRKALSARGVDGVVLVSELHAAGALAQAVGRAVGYERTALMFLEGDTASLSIVETASGGIVAVQTRRLRASDPMSEIREMAVGIEMLDQTPQGLFIVGSGIDVGAVKSQITAVLTLPVHAPEEAELALARGAALAAAHTPRYEATTEGWAYARDVNDTGAEPTQLADAGYMAPLGYSDAVDDGFDGELLEVDPLDVELAAELDLESDESDRKPFLLVGSALTSVFVVGIIALAISLVVSIRPAVDQKPSGNVTPGTQTAALVDPQEQAPPPAPPAVETIQEPVPVVRQAPRTVFVNPAPLAPASVPAPVAPAPVLEAPAPAPAAPLPAPPQVVPVPAAPAIPVIPVAPPIYFPPVIVTPPIYNPRPRATTTSNPPTTSLPTSSPTPASPTETTSPSTSQTAAQAPASTSQVPTQNSVPSTSEIPSQSSSQAPSQSSSQGQSTLWPSFTGR